MRRWQLITEDFPPGFTGGIASWASDLAHALAGSGADTRVWARNTGATATYDDALPWEMHRMRGRHWGRWRGRWVEIALMGKIAADDRLIFANWGLAQNMLGVIRRRGARLGVAFHGSDLTQLHAAPAQLHQIVGAADALLPVSEFLAQELCRLGLVNRSDPRIHILPMPLAEMPERTGPGQGLICVARPTDLKGIDRAQALATALDMELTLVGPESPGTGILPRAKVHAAMARSAACLLLPKIQADGRGAEGLGLVLIEAAAQGVPVIGCDTGGVPEAVGPGLIIDPDNPDLTTIRAFLNDKSAGINARTWVQTHHGAHRALATLEDALK